MSWRTAITVFPDSRTAAAVRLNRAMMWLTSRFEVASSRISTGVSWARARAKMTRCRSPPLSSETYRPASRSVPVMAMTRSTRSRSSADGLANRGMWGYRPIITTSRAVKGKLMW